MGESSRNLAYEAVGTFLLTFIGAASIITTQWNGSPGLVGIALAHGIALAIAVSASMNLSGGHINPAVTVSMLVTGRISLGNAIGYILAQCAGAVVAGFLLGVVFGGLGAGAAGVDGSAAMAACKLGTPYFNPPVVSATTAIIMEAVMTFVLVFAVFGTAVDGRTPRIAGFGIGLAVTIDILAGGPITGASMNPARTLGTLVGGGAITSDLWSQHWVYWVGPILGAVVAAFFYDGLIMDRKGGSKA